MDARSPEPAPIDRYVVLEYLAEGGMGAIYLGKRMGAGGFEKQVVLKQLLPEFTRQQEFIDLFLREARLSATLDHANIIHTIDLVTAGEDYFIVMEYLDGADLRTLLKRARRRRRKLSAAAGIYIARELLSAMAYAHNKLGPDGAPIGLIHRDISPSNILVSGSGEVKLTDFGIAKASTHNSMFYRVKGKVGYMSPEQAASDPIDARSDLYSLATCLFEMISGERLFVNAGLTTSVEEMYGVPIPLLSRKVPGLPPELDKVMLKALSRDPDHRYQSAGELQDALLRCAHRHGLLMSAPELAEHLREVCGDPDRWRDEPGEGTRGAGTELYEFDGAGGTEQIDLNDESEAILSDSDVLSMAADGTGLHSLRDRKSRRHKTSITRLTELKGIELTSMIKMAAADHLGAAPLVDLDDLAASPAALSAPPASSAPAPAPSPRGTARDDSTGVVVSRGPPRTSRAPDPPAPAGVGPRLTARPVRSARGGARPWLLLGVILLAGVGTALAIGLSGPSLDDGDGGDGAPPAVAAPAAAPSAPVR